MLCSLDQGASSVGGTRFAWGISETLRAHRSPRPWTLQAPGTCAFCERPSPLLWFFPANLGGKD